MILTVRISVAIATAICKLRASGLSGADCGAKGLAGTKMRFGGWRGACPLRIKGLEGALLDARALGRSNTRPSSGGQVAQLVEQRTENPRVGGSIPPLATRHIERSAPDATAPAGDGWIVSV